LERELTPELTKIKEIAIVGMQTNFQKTAEQSISILLNFSVSEVGNSLQIMLNTPIE
jgi:predicted CoA-binding protein